MLYSWLHLIALIVYLGAVVGFWLMLLPSVAALEKHEDKAQLLARGLKFYNPLQIGALGVILFTGAFQLTELKAAYREMFVKQVAYNLGIKLAFAFVLVIFSVYQALGIGHRFVRRYEGGETVTADQLSSIIRRLKSANWGILILAAITLWLGFRLRA
ncbi:MAG TPA: hypothetical protein VKR81_14740 [Candidatus Binatia bacterium]|jgi:uncharacterized membrane protein|nr:hypothetical protein [Candidatus Binatia bacterium]